MSLENLDADGANPEKIPLDRLQRWMMSVISNVGGTVEGIESARVQRNAASGDIDVALEDIERVVSRSAQLTSIERLQVYSNAYYARLIECLQEEFPTLTHTIGNDAFANFAIDYLNASPPHSYTLAMLGESFPSFLQDTRPEKPTGNDTPDFADFLIDVALLERTYSEVFDGPGNETLDGESSRGLDADALSKLTVDQCAGARLIPASSLRMMTLRFPVHEYATSVRVGEHPAIPAPQQTRLIISRHEYIVRRRAVSEDEFRLLETIIAGATIGEAIEDMMNGSEISMDQCAVQLGEWFGHWATLDVFQELVTE